MQNEPVDSIKPLLRDLDRRWNAPKRSVTFYKHLIVGVLVGGGAGIWFTLCTKGLNTPEVAAALLTYFPPLVAAAENDFAPTIAEIRRSGNWAVSTATVVEGIVRLITSNPKKDAFAMDGKLEYKVQDRSVLEPARDPKQTPLRELFRFKNDDLIYTGVKNYFDAADRLFWEKATPDSYIRKTVGVQALFDVARPLMNERVEKKDFRQIQFEERLKPAAHIDFADRHFEASGRGRQWIRTSIELCLGLRELDSVKDEDRGAFREICGLK